MTVDRLADSPQRPVARGTGSRTTAAADVSPGFWRRVGSDPKALGFWMTLPTVPLLLFIVVFPLLMQLYLGVTSWSPLDGMPWYRAHEGFSWLA